MSVAAKIRQYLNDNEIPQIQVSIETGIAPAKLNLTLNEKRKLTFSEYEAICFALELPVGSFLEARPLSTNPAV